MMEEASSTPQQQMMIADQHHPAHQDLDPELLPLEQGPREGRSTEEEEATESSISARKQRDVGGGGTTTHASSGGAATKLDVPTLTTTQPTPVKLSPTALNPNDRRGDATGDSPPMVQQHKAGGSRTRDQVEKDLHYLAKHNVCQTLELMVKQLLRDRPDDPTLAVCNMLRSGAGARVNPLRNSGKSLQLPPPPTPTSELDERETPHASPTQPDAPRGGSFPLPVKTRALGTTTTLTNTATGQQHQQQQQRYDNSGQALSRGGSSLTAGQGGQSNSVRPTSSSSAGSASILRKPGGVRSTSATPSQNNNTTAVAAGAHRRDSAGHPTLTAQGAGAGSATGTSSFRTLERDESTKSEISTFSVNSVDMGEFIAEFRAAHHAVFPKGCEVISRNDLAEVVDRVALPLPDIRMLADLFSEIDTADCDLVKFDVFLARMCFKIQGRYQQEVLRGIFYSMIPGGHATLSRQAAAAASVHHSHNHGGGGRGGIPPSISMSSLPDEAANYHPHPHHHHHPVKGGAGQHGDPASAPHWGAEGGGGEGVVVCDDEKVPRLQCLEEGLRSGLGLRVNIIDFNEACKRISIPLSDDALVELSDFQRLVHAIAAAAGGGGGSGGGPTSSVSSPSVGGGGYASGHHQLGSSLLEDQSPVMA